MACFEEGIINQEPWVKMKNTFIISQTPPVSLAYLQLVWIMWYAKCWSYISIIPSTLANQKEESTILPLHLKFCLFFKLLLYSYNTDNI